MAAVLEAEQMQRRRVAIVADAGGYSDTAALDDRRTIRPRTALEHGPGFERRGVQPRNACRTAVGGKDFSVVGDGAGHAPKSRQCRDVPLGIVVDHLDAIARGVGYEDPPGLRVKRRVVKLAVCGVGYLDDAKFLQRHDGLPARCHHDRLRSEARRMGGPSMRNLLEVRVLRRAWTGSRLAGSLRVPVF